MNNKQLLSKINASGVITLPEDHTLKNAEMALILEGIESREIIKGLNESALQAANNASNDEEVEELKAQVDQLNAQLLEAGVKAYGGLNVIHLEDEDEEKAGFYIIPPLVGLVEEGKPVTYSAEDLKGDKEAFDRAKEAGAIRKAESVLYNGKEVYLLFRKATLNIDGMAKQVNTRMVANNEELLKAAIKQGIAKAA